MSIYKTHGFWPVLVLIPMLAAAVQGSDRAPTEPSSTASQEATGRTPGAPNPKSTAPRGSAPTRNLKAPARIAIAKDTTWVLGPVDKEGNIDYVGALRERYSKGITPENNAAILFWQAAGPWDIPVDRRVEFFGALGISPPPLPKEGDFFPGLDVVALALASSIPARMRARSSRNCARNSTGTRRASGHGRTSQRSLHGSTGGPYRWPNSSKR